MQLLFVPAFTLLWTGLFIATHYFSLLVYGIQFCLLLARVYNAPSMEVV